MNWRYFILAPVFIITTVYMGRIITGAPFTILSVAAAIVIGLIAFNNPENGLLVLVFSMLLSPEIRLADVPGRALTLRIDDLLIIAVFIAWLAHISMTRDWRGFVKTGLDLPIFLLLIVYVFGTARGIIFGSVNPLKSFFYLLKYIEYFILFWLVTNIVTTRDAVSRYLTAGFITFIAVTLFAYSQFGHLYAVSAPFDKAGGEPASLGGYFLVVYAVLFGFLIHVESNNKRLLCLALIIFLLPPFVRTFSRASYIAFAPMMLSMLAVTKKRRMIFGAVILAGVIIFPIIFQGLYANMVKRIMVTFTGSHSSQYGTQIYKLGGQKINDQSALERIASWKWVIQHRFKRDQLTMLAGSGVTGLGFIEGQFFLVLGEGGIIGVIAFYWLMFRIIAGSLRIYRSATEVIPQSLSIAAMGGLIGLLFQSFTTNTFIIVRIMEPFWFLVALVMISPDIYTNEPPASVV
jgi:hypothetical protein